MRKFKAAVVQAAPVYLDLEGSVNKACTIIQEAASQGADLIAFPEVFLPGYPYWIWLNAICTTDAYMKAMFLNSPTVPGEEIAKISKCIREAGCYVVLGISERDNKSLYNTLVFFDSAGEVIGKHRKLKGTSVEKMVWADGDGGTLRVHSTPWGKLSGLICGEHSMAIPGYILGAMGEDIHVATWVGLNSCFAPERRKAFTNLTESAAKFHAISYNTVVLNSQSHVDEYTLEVLGHPQGLDLGGGWSAIIAPGSGDIVAGPLIDKEGILYADIDLAESIPMNFRRDATGYGHAKCYTIRFDASQHPPILVQNGNGETNGTIPLKSETDLNFEDRRC